jgi:hypothetical protein
MGQPRTRGPVIPRFRFSPKNGHPLAIAGCPRSATIGHQKSFTAKFFTNLNQMHTDERKKFARPDHPDLFH